MRVTVGSFCSIWVVIDGILIVGFRRGFRFENFWVELLRFNR